MSPPKIRDPEDRSQLTARATSDRDLREFLLRACHDLRGSLRAIRAHTELIQKSTRSDDGAGLDRNFGFIANGVRRIELITDGLSGYSIALQLEEASFQPVRMDVMLRTALARIDQEMHERGAEVTSGELPQIFGNADRLAQVFENLLRNAVQHRGANTPRIHIQVEKQAAADQQEEWLFAVRDNGPGIDAAYLERIFKPFERLHATEGGGVGMGLAICRAIVERHGGKIWAESTPGSGSAFLFTLPAISQ